jgi:hypothetical protein
MGRPLNKKYFGNRNTGVGGNQTDGNLSNSQNYADDRIGGGAVATFTVATGGTYQARPTATVTSFFPGGVAATGTTTLEVASAVVTAGGGAGTDNYTTSDVVTVTTASGVATFTVTADVDGVVTAVAPLARGTFAGVLATGAQATTTVGTGVGCTLTLTYRVKSIQVGTTGSGHKAGSTVTITGANTGSAATATVATIAADTGVVGSATNQENAIVIRAKIDAEATVRVGDILKQSSARRYKVKTTDGIAVCKLVADDTPATFEAYIIATDANGNTYYVTKLTARRATLTRKTQNGASTWLVVTDASAPWSFTSTADGRVIIENA